VACHWRALDAAARPWGAVELVEWLLAMRIVQGRRVAVGRVRLVRRRGADVVAVWASAEGMRAGPIMLAEARAAVLKAAESWMCWPVALLVVLGEGGAEGEMWRESATYLAQNR
jgi:hypothetical protein